MLFFGKSLVEVFLSASAKVFLCLDRSVWDGCNWRGREGGEKHFLPLILLSSKLARLGHSTSGHVQTVVNISELFQSIRSLLACLWILYWFGVVFFIDLISVTPSQVL